MIPHAMTALERYYLLECIYRPSYPFSVIAWSPFSKVVNTYVDWFYKIGVSGAAGKRTTFSAALDVCSTSVPAALACNKPFVRLF